MVFITTNFSKWAYILFLLEAYSLSYILTQLNCFYIDVNPYCNFQHCFDFTY